MPILLAASSSVLIGALLVYEQNHMVVISVCHLLVCNAPRQGTGAEKGVAVQVARDLEDPFVYSPNDLPTARLQVRLMSCKASCSAWPLPNDAGTLIVSALSRSILAIHSHAICCAVGRPNPVDVPRHACRRRP